MGKNYFCEKINEEVKIFYFAPKHQDTVTGEDDSPSPRPNDCDHKNLCPIVSKKVGSAIHYNYDGCPIIDTGK